MVIIRSKKNKKQRGSMTYGWGSKKKHRGAGSRGGRGRAGAGKHGIHKREALPDIREKGFNGYKKANKILNFRRLDQLITKGTIKKEGDFYVIDGSQIGYDKLLGSGNLNLKLKVSNINFTSKAKEKVEKLGGEVAE